MWWVLGCAGDAEVPDGDGFTVEVTVSVPTEAAPLVRALHVEATAPVTVRASWDDGEQDAASVAFAPGGATQDHLLVGFRPGRRYTLTVEVEGSDGQTASTAVQVDTDPLPAHFPQAEATGWVEPGHTLVSMRSNGAPRMGEVAAVYDEVGEIRWFLAVDDVLQDVREVDGELWVLSGSLDASLARVGWDGVVRERWAIGPGGVQPQHARLMHHDAAIVPGQDRIVALGRAGLPVPDYPADYDDPTLTAPRVVSDDVVLVFGTDGTIEQEVRLSERLPLDRIGYDSLSTTIDGGADWAHANALVWDDGELLVSLRHQDALVKLDGAGAIRWILANPANWPEALDDLRLVPVGDTAAFRWPYHQHGPHLGPPDARGERVLLVYDNGNYQASPWTGEPPLDPTAIRSRVVQYTVDEQARTVRQDWSFDAPGGGALFSEAVGDADLLPGGTVLSTWGFLDHLPDGRTNAELGLGQRSVRILEIDPRPVATGGEVQQVGELYLYTESDDNAAGWTAYRAQRIGSLDGRQVD